MVREIWRLLDLEYEDPYLNMAVEEAVARKVGEGVVPNTVRFWRNVNAVVVGCFQRVDLEVNLESCKKYGVKVIRRFSGGGAVYHDHGNLNYSFSMRRNDPLIPQTNIFQIVERLSSCIIKAFEILGLAAELKSRNEIDINGRKVSGSAGALKWGVLFHHGSILVNSELSILSEVLNVLNSSGSKKDSYVRSIRRRVTNIQDELGRDITMQEVKEAVRRGIETILKIRLVEDALTKEEMELAIERSAHHCDYSEILI